MRPDQSISQSMATLTHGAAERKTKRVSLDYVTWRARIAAPGSRFEPEQPVEPQIVRLVPVRRAADLPEVEKRTA